VAMMASLAFDALPGAPNRAPRNTYSQESAE
jgi:hypothetical protein